MRGINIIAAVVLSVSLINSIGLNVTDWQLYAIAFSVGWIVGSIK